MSYTLPKQYVVMTCDSVHFPGSRQYTSIGEIENRDEVGDAEAGDIVKVMGSKEICVKAAELLQASMPLFSKSYAEVHRYRRSDLLAQTTAMGNRLPFCRAVHSMFLRNTITRSPISKT